MPPASLPAHYTNNGAGFTFTRRLQKGDEVSVLSDEPDGPPRAGTVVGLSRKGPYTVQTSNTKPVVLLPHELRVEGPGSSHVAKSPVFETTVPWHPRLAGRLWEMPTLGCGRLGLDEKPLRFTFPDLDQSSGPYLYLHVELPLCTEASFVLPHLLPAAWAASRRHWRVGGHWGHWGVPSSPSAPSPSTPPAPSELQQRPNARAAARGHQVGPHLEQREDGTIRLLQQCTGGCRQSFMAAMSTHLIESGEHTFTFELLQCATDLATGIRLGVCSEDGSRQWMLRLSDGRICDETGAPLTEPMVPSEEELRCSYKTEEAYTSSSDEGEMHGAEGHAAYGEADHDEQQQQQQLQLGGRAASRHASTHASRALSTRRASAARRVRTRDPIVDKPMLPSRYQKVKLECRTFMATPTHRRLQFCFHRHLDCVRSTHTPHTRGSQPAETRASSLYAPICTHMHPYAPREDPNQQMKASCLATNTCVEAG